MSDSRSDFLEGDYRELQSRNIRQSTCEFWGYQVGEYQGQACQIANYTKGGKLVAQKIRLPDKKFKVIGEGKSMPLYGRDLWKDSGRKLTIVEGEIDALSLSQCWDNKWPVVSLPNGAHSAEKVVSENLDWIEQFDEVVFMFDMDDPGQDAAKECALLLSPGKAKIARLPLKDANEMIKANRQKELISAVWDAKTFRPDGIISGTDTWEKVRQFERKPGFPYPWKDLQDLTDGIRKREITTLCAGSGLGKSTICRELAYEMMKTDVRVGYIALEESVERTTLGFMSLELNRPLHLGGNDLQQPEVHEAWQQTAGSGNLYLYDHWGSLQSDNLLAKVRYMAVALACDYIFLDHISIVVSGMETVDERRTIDELMTKLRSLVEETGVGLVLVSHLKRPEGKGHEEGARVTLAQLRGSAAIAQLSDLVIGLERNQQGDDPDELLLRVLKNRYSGNVGPASTLLYDRETGRLTEVGGF